MPLTRVEVRFRRDVLRELKAAHLASSPEEMSPLSWFDDPWRALEHLGELWAYFSGLPPEADLSPEVTYRGWMRLAQPTSDDSNRSRWPTDPVWEAIQRAQFSATPPRALTRQPTVRHDLAQVDAERGRDFAEEVREKARMLGKPVPPRLHGPPIGRTRRHLTRKPARKASLVS
jgi:hypothetical protein